ncbi:hypothetical protein NUW54_g3951 [Trametes sanguinea]|uniref:Uncharacterized protein n=1 Tax=Trametes sanguinea TaxID=158606 RepID=A0ACC1Q2F6_9APHY|nr:hypothetical protein NUW54_g3951 [Trametes sanguinea]
MLVTLRTFGFPLRLAYPSSVAMACPEDINALILSQIQLGPTIGVGYLGVAISSAIYGVTCIQTFHYFRSPRLSSDKLLLKIIVTALWMLDTAHQAIIIFSLYHYLILNYANPASLLKEHWSIGTEIIVNAVIAFIVESFFVTRIWKSGCERSPLNNQLMNISSHTVSKNAYVSGACMLFTVAHLSTLATSLSMDYYITHVPDPPPAMNLRAYISDQDSTGSSGLGVAVLADVSISAAMVWYLHRGRTGLRKSDDMISRLIILTITTGSLTTTFVIANLIAYLAAPAQLYTLFFNFMLGKLYINSLLTSLNGREFVRGKDLSSQFNTIPLSTFQGAPNGTATLSTGDVHNVKTGYISEP